MPLLDAISSEVANWADLLFVTGGVTALLGHLSAASNRVFGDVLGRTIDRLIRLRYDRIPARTATWFMRSLKAIPALMRGLIGISYERVGFRSMGTVLAAGMLSFGGATWGLSRLGVQDTLFGLHPVLWFVIFSSLMLLSWEAVNMAHYRAGRSTVVAEAFSNLGAGAILAAFGVFAISVDSLALLAGRVEVVSTSRLLWASLTMVPFLITLLFMVSFLLIALLSVVAGLVLKLFRRSASDDEHQENGWWRFTYFVFGALPSIPLTALAFYVGELSGSPDPVNNRVQMIGANLCFDLLTFVVTIGVVGGIAGTRSTIRAGMLVVLDAFFAGAFAVASLYLGTVGTPSAVSLAEAVQVLAVGLLSPQAAMRSTYFMAMSTALLPTLMVLAAIIMVLVGKLAADLLRHLYGRATDRPLVFVGSIGMIVGGLVNGVLRLGAG